jgi:hypothetical protein
VVGVYLVISCRVFRPGEDLHEDEPAEHEAIVAFPKTGHALTGSDESGQIHEGNHHGQAYPRMSDTETG